MTIELEKTTFTPAEAEAITGVSVAQQRNLRRHDYIAKTEGGWTRFTLEEMAQLFVIGKLSERGIGPSKSSAIAKTKLAGRLVMGYALECPGAVHDPKKLAGNERPKYSKDRLRRFMIVYGTDGKRSVFQDDPTAFYAREWDTDLTATIVLDLQRIGRLLCERAARPIATVTEAG